MRLTRHLAMALLTSTTFTVTAAPYSNVIKLTPKAVIEAASQSSSEKRQHLSYTTMPAQDFAARQARLIVSSLTEEAELLKNSL